MQKYNESVERQGGRCKCDGSFDPPVYIETGEEEHPTFYIWIWCGQHHNVGWNLNASNIFFSSFLLWFHENIVYIFFIVSCHMFDISPYRMYVIFGFKFFFLEWFIKFFFSLCLTIVSPRIREKKNNFKKSLSSNCLFYIKFSELWGKKEGKNIVFVSKVCLKFASCL